MDFADLRLTLVSALAWRVVAELFRRYDRTADLHILEVHPGISMRGSLWVAHGNPFDPDCSVLRLNLGGPSGTFEITRRVDSATVPSETLSGEFAQAMLMVDPAVVVDSIAEAWGLAAPRKPLPASTPATTTLRVIAGLLERLVFDRVAWRTTAGYCDASVGSLAPGWLDALGECSAAAARGSSPDIRVVLPLTRYILLHQAINGVEICRTLADVPGTAIALNLNGTATVLTRHGTGERIDLAARYQELGRDIRRLVGDLEARLAL